MAEPVFPTTETTEFKPAGYAALVNRFRLKVIPNWHQSFVSDGNVHKIDTIMNTVREIYPAKYWHGSTLGDHLEFAVKYDGTNLAILACIFRVAPPKEMVDYIASKPRGKYVRRLWFLYELLTGTTLPLDDLSTGGYIPLLEPDKYYTITNPKPIRRQRIYDNLLGNSQFCPIIRRTNCLRTFEEARLSERCQKIVAEYSPLLLKRAMSFMYLKETKSSFEIEHIHPDSTRIERFVTLLQSAEQNDFCTKTKLIDIQNQIVCSRFQDKDYRRTQIYVGESVSWVREKIHFVAPKPEDLPKLMEGLILSHERMNNGNVSAVIHAAAISYGFVFLHPFEDGNGRIHRFLIHNILVRRGFTPSGIIFPVSAMMLNNLVEYDASLESFSRPLMELTDYVLDSEGRMTVRNETAFLYKYNDMTVQTEWLFHLIEQTIETELIDELTYLTHYDQAKKSIQNIVDMPDRKIDLFIQSCILNDGCLATKKRKRHFEFLTDSEITEMEKVIQSIYEPKNKNHKQKGTEKC
jgi:hypothetical protein